MAEFFDTVAELGSEEEDEDFNGEEGENGNERLRKTNGANGQIDDSSEEEDEDDEAALREAGEGFLVDDEDEEEEVSRRKRKKKRKHRERSDEALDEEDLDLIGVDYEPREASQSKYKRLKRGNKERSNRDRGVDEIFSDDEDLDEGDDSRRGPRANLADEFADFIEEDQFEDDIEDEREVGQPGISIITSGLQAAGLDEGAEEDYRAAFGDGTDYDWALELQEAQDEEELGEGRELQLQDVFEPAQLQERMLTDEDNIIRETDIPERLQIARKPFKPLDPSEVDMDDRLQQESLWVSQLIWPKKGLPRYYLEPFQKAVKNVLDFMVVQDYEVPFIFNHRKDYLIHAPSPHDQDQDDPDAPFDAKPERLLNQLDLWEIFELDLKYRALAEKRDALQKHYDNLRASSDTDDAVLNDLIPVAVTIEEIQELQDYLHFQYATQMKDLRFQDAERNGAQKRAMSSRSFFDKIRASSAYNLVRAFGITPDTLAQRADGALARSFVEDPSLRPDDLADSLIDPPEYSTGAQVLKAAKTMYIQELIMSPRLRRYLRGAFYERGSVDCIRTEKGLRKITEDHPYYEFKYLRKQTFHDLSSRPELFLKMLKAEAEGLVQVKIRIGKYEEFKEKLANNIISDGYSETIEAWNNLRRDVLDVALVKLEDIIATGVKETLRSECEKDLAGRARESFYSKLDQAPWRPKGQDLGTAPNVLAVSHGKGQRGDAICWAFVEHNGQVREAGKFVEFRIGNRDRNIPDGKDIGNFVEIVNRRRPDVIAISGFSVETKKLMKDLQEIISLYDLRGSEYEDPDTDLEKSDPLEVILVNDEVARLYYNSPRSAAEFPKYPPLTRYCVALAWYMQNPLSEYASLGPNIVSIPFVQDQTLIPQETLMSKLEAALVDMVNLVGINLTEAWDDPQLSKLLPYVCGLGPRKADQLKKAIQANGDVIQARFDLIGITTIDGDNRELKAAMGPKVFANCASFLYLVYEQSEPISDYLDNTRVHPEDYDLARKMVADALGMDEEDIKAEVDEGGQSAVVRKMVREDATDNIQDLVLEGYAEEIEKKLGNRKRATLETIRAELAIPYEEIRQPFSMLSTDEAFTMLTGETKDSLTEGMVVPVTIKRTFPDHIEVKLESGIDGGVSESEYPEGVGSGGVEPRTYYSVGQTVRARVMFLNRKALTAQLSFREDLVRQPGRKELDHMPGDWDEDQEAEDKRAAERAKEVATGRAHRVVNHPLFYAMNSAQAEEFLGSKEVGDAIIRPSSKGLDHLAVTWKVSQNLFQHIDVLELGKPNEYSLGKKLRIGSHEYSDLDELLVNHVEAMARKVGEMTRDDRFKSGSKETVDAWLETYCKANPRRSMYAFCYMPKYPGYFWLCYRASEKAAPGAWPVKVEPNAFKLQGNVYPDMTALKNGFKLLVGSAGARPQPPRR